ncbi:MAG: hypothetical protein AAF412_01085 [Pseudomonadota bacterium]
MSVVLKFPLERVSRTVSGKTKADGAVVLLFEGIRYSQGDELELSQSEKPDAIKNH